MLSERRLHAFTLLGIIGTLGFLLIQAADDETIRAQAQEITGRIEHGLREGSRRMILTRDLPDVLTGPAEVIDARTLRYIDTDLTVRLVGIDICAPDQKATFAGTPWPCADMATAWLVSQTLGRDLQCQRLGRQFDGIINARCAIEGADIAGEAILAGHALVNRTTRPGVPVPLATYIELEDRARAARAGLWSSEFTRPEDFRRRQVNENTAPARPVGIVPLEPNSPEISAVPPIAERVSP